MRSRNELRRAFGPGLLAWLLSSCLSIGTIAGYRPSGSGSATGPPPSLQGDTWTIPLPHGAAVLVLASRTDVYPTPFEQITLDVSLLVPDGVTVQFLATELELASPEWPAPRFVRIACIEDWTGEDPDARVHAADSLLRGSAKTHVSPGFGLALVRAGPRSQTGIPAVAAFELQLPGLRVEGKTIVPASIRFEAYERFGVRLARD